MSYERKGTRELYAQPCRIAYGFFADEKKVVFLTLYHKDDQ
jgi:hypothetical protein